MTVPQEKAPAKYVPAAAVIRMGQALSGIIGRKECVGGYLSARFNLEAQPHSALRTGLLECRRGKRNSQAAFWTVTDTEARKRGEQTGLDTLVVHAVNDEH